jgi:hypothetical protein
LLLLTLPAVVQAQFNYGTYNGSITITGYTGPGGDVTIPSKINGLPVTSIGDWAFTWCTSLTNVTIGTNVTDIGDLAFQECTSLSSVTIPNSVTKIGDKAFYRCTRLTAITVDPLNAFYSSLAGVLFNKSQIMLIQCPEGKAGSYTIPDGVASIGVSAFFYCTNLTSVSIPNSVTSLGDDAFYDCASLAAVYFQGNAPSADWSVFESDNNASVYYLPATTGWGLTFGGRPTALLNAPAILRAPQTQTAEVGSAVGLTVKASGLSPLFCLCYLNSTNLISGSTNSRFELTNVQFSESGAYTVVVTNAAGAITSAPALLNVIAAVERRPVPGVKLTGDAGSLLNVDCANSLTATTNWTTLGSISVTNTSQYYFDLTLPLPPQRFYRAWQTGIPSLMPSLDLHMIPAITLTGSIGNSVRLDYINKYGPIDAWVTLDTVTLTNTSQLYFDTSAPGKPPRLYRLLASP